MATRFNLGQRVNTPLGKATIDTLPYNEESNTYGVWLDNAYYFCGVTAQHWLALNEDKLTPIN